MQIRLVYRHLVQKKDIPFLYVVQIFLSRFEMDTVLEEPVLWGGYQF